jgi:putative restriction endonuclease
MYIMKRPSRGRGEYELAEPFNQLTPHDLTGKNLLILYGRYGVHPTGVYASNQGGKHRLRLHNERRDIHIPRQIQAALLFPKAIRDEDRLPGGQPTIMEERYLVRRIHLDDIAIVGDDAELKVGKLELDNGSQRSEEVDFTERLARVEQLHSLAGKFPRAIEDLLLEHKSLILANAPLPARAEEIVQELMGNVFDNAADYDIEYVNGTDVVVPLEEILKLPEFERPVAIESIPLEDVEIRVREAARWRRWAACRGSKSAAFRRSVRAAYDSRCVVCGLRLPQNALCRVPGVDAAHILPWSDYDIDELPNGVCLCKLHHWAFDQQLIAITFEAPMTYKVLVTQRAVNALANDPQSLQELRRHEGTIARERLPANRQHWPAANLLAKLYEDVEIG